MARLASPSDGAGVPRVPMRTVAIRNAITPTASTPRLARTVLISVLPELGRPPSGRPIEEVYGPGGRTQDPVSTSARAPSPGPSRRADLPIRNAAFQAIGLCPREADGRTLQDEGGSRNAHLACRRWFPIVRPRQRPRRRVAAAGRRSSPHRQRRSRRDRSGRVAVGYPVGSDAGWSTRTRCGSIATPSKRPSARSAPPAPTSSSNRSSPTAERRR